MSEDLNNSVAKACSDLGITVPQLDDIFIELYDKKKNVIDVLSRDFKKDLVVDERLIDQMLITLPMIFAYYSTMLSKARSLERMFENELKRTIALVTISTRGWLMGEGNAKPTVGVIDSYVETDQAVIEARDNLAKANEWVDMIKTAVDALYHKRECVNQLANNRRKEMEVQMQRRTFRSGVEDE